MKKVLIITGGRTNTDFVKEVYEEYSPDIVIVADRGVMAAKESDIIPDYLVGDFDSGDSETVEYFKSQFERHGKPIVRTFNPEKDDTDTEIAISLALTLKPDDIVIIGLLHKVMGGGIKARIIDEYNVISIHDKEITLKRDTAFGEYFSLLPFTESVKGLNIKGAKYELENYILSSGNSLGISNEFKKDKVKISFNGGILLLFQTSDKRLVLRGKM